MDPADKANARSHGAELRAAGTLAVEATKAITGVVRDVHGAIASGPAVLGRPLSGPVQALTGLWYGAIQGVTTLVGAALDRVLLELAPLLGESTPGPQREAVLAVLNGVLGDYLAQTNNPLATQMQLRIGGAPVVPAQLTGRKALLLVHGSAMTDRQWTRLGHDHGAALARDLGSTALYLTYNSGLHISTNGRAFADLLEQTVAAWQGPLDELCIVGHSMGGLVARSACHYGAQLAWRKKLRKLVFLGTPHHGSPLERSGNLAHLLLGVTAYSAPFARLARIRSAGVTDLRYGNVIDEDWAPHERFAHTGDVRALLPLPAGVECYAVAASRSPVLSNKPAGDGLVPVDSALGRHPKLGLAFPEGHTFVVPGAGHLDLLSRPEVYAKLREWLATR